MKIFISIASYQDPMLLETICSAYTHAINKDGLRFGICEQSDNPTNLNNLEFFDQIEYELVDPVMAKGPCWARERIQRYCKDEEYYLQVDSHTVFYAGWDGILLSYYNWIKESGINKFVITGYPRSFKPNKFRNSFDLNVQFKSTLGITFREGRLFEDNYFSMQKSYPAKTYRPVKGLLVAAGFMFSESDLIKEIPYDPNLYFHGEELSLALRLFTNGWDIVHIPRVPLFHLYTDVNNLPRKLHWNKDDEKNRAVKWNELDRSSKQRLGQLILGQIDDKYGLGNKRTVKEFSNLCGLDLKQKKVIDLEKATEYFPFEVIERSDYPFKEVVVKND